MNGEATKPVTAPPGKAYVTRIAAEDGPARPLTVVPLIITPLTRVTGAAAI